MPAEPNLPTPALPTSPTGAAAGYTYPTAPTPTYNAPPATAWNANQPVMNPNYPTSPPMTGGPSFPTGTVPNGQPNYGPNNGQPNYNPSGQPQPGAGVNFVNGQREPASASDKTQVAKQPDSQWLGLTLTMILLCTSVACNLYFGWSKYQMQERYRLLLVDRGAYSS
jgi:hypothetical protein